MVNILGFVIVVWEVSIYIDTEIWISDSVYVL